ncbi:hypothetical protein VTL71DRAFT_12030 [Oculimacula yallundae]|uniref:Uncharacterized protein n=1 Tax=Oculimacula yallundae TaxID=86028 RepID=A0ABR4CSD3_9HELO
MSTTMDTEPVQVNVPTLVDNIISGRLRTGKALPKLDPTRGEELRSMLIAEADLLKSKGKEADALKIRMIEGRVAESLDYDEHQKGGLDHSSTLNEQDSVSVEAHGSKAGGLQGMSAFTSINTIDSLDFDELDRALASMPKAGAQTPKTSPSSLGKSRSKPQTQKTPPQPLKFDMSPASKGPFERLQNPVSKTSKAQPKLTLPKFSVSKEPQSGSATNDLGKENTHDGNETKRATSDPITGGEMFACSRLL